MTGPDRPHELIDFAHDVIDDLKAQGAGLDGSDSSLWFLQGVAQSMAGDPDAQSGAVLLAYAVYVAETLAATCPGVRVVVDVDGRTVREVCAVRDGGVPQNVLSWLRQAVDDPAADNLVFKYSGALRDFDEDDRARVLEEQLAEYRAGG
jgi:hypothetical protein